MINGDAEARGKFFGRAFGEVALAVVGTKGVDKAVKAAKGTKIVQEAAKGYKVVKSDVANKVGNVKVPVRAEYKVLATPDGSNVGMWIVETKPVRELYQKFAVKDSGIADNIASGSNSLSKYDDIQNYMYNSYDNPGPLAEFRGQPNKNFYGGRYNIEVLDEPKIFYRAGDLNSPLGQWFTETPPNSSAEVRINTAVKEQWLDKNGVLTGTSPLNTVYEIEIPAGTTIYKGPVGNQGGIYQGGLDINQIYIKEPWNIEGVRVVGSGPLK